MRSQKFSAGDHLYLQVAGALEKMIDEEILKIGDKLPSVRVLSEKMGSAWAQLSRLTITWKEKA